MPERSHRPRLNFSREHPNLTFWASFAVLNLLLFLPLALLDQDEFVLLPPLTIFAHGPLLSLSQLFIWRESVDPLRISVELAVLAALWVNVRRLQIKPLRWTFIVLYLLMLAYYIYEAIMISIYRADPVFYSHYFLARDGLPFLAQHVGASPWVYLVGWLGFVLGVGAVVALVQTMLAGGAAMGRWSRYAVGALAVLCVAAVPFYQAYTSRSEMVPSSLGWKLQKNVTASWQLYQDIAGYDDRAARTAYNYSGYQLEQKPDIYLIFVESYGSVLYKRADFLRAYTSLLDELQGELAQHGWQSTTALSRSPTWGGGSWLAYTSFLFGLRIDNQPQYLALRTRYQVADYPDLGSTLREQGYRYAWVSSLDENLNDHAWARFENFLDPDVWLRHKDLDYRGPQYGWGPAPPDQYVLNYTAERLQRESDQPLFYVTITQNSHYPWDLPPALLDDWRTFNTMPAATTTTDDELEHADKRRRYTRAIEYELRMLTDFILRHGDENSIFLLVGDHQPPQVSRRADGWETPVHIVAKNPAFLASFEEYGFTPGLRADLDQPPLRHEGMYSLLMRELFSHYGSGQIAVPGYWPDGVN
jgi:phosphoglycerol transferase MdoB-like AlkP superfamily enzyme